MTPPPPTPEREAVIRESVKIAAAEGWRDYGPEAQDDVCDLLTALDASRAETERLKAAGQRLHAAVVELAGDDADWFQADLAAWDEALADRGEGV